MTGIVIVESLAISYNKKVMNNNGTNRKIQYDFVSYKLKELTTKAPKIYYIAK